MVGRQIPHHRDLRRIAIAAVVVIVLVMGGGAALTLYAASSVDRVQADREQTLALRRLSRMQTKAVDDIVSASIWNDGVVALSGAPDLDWLQTNITDYYADYMGHEVTLVYGPDGALVDAGLNSERVQAPQVAAFQTAFRPLVAVVQKESTNSAKRAAYAFDAVTTRSDVVMVQGRPWIVAASSVVPEDDKVARPDRDPVIVSALPLSAYLTSLREDLALEGATFTRTSDHPAMAGHIQIKSAQGAPIGWLDWTPQRPGGQIVGAALPVAAALLLLLAAAGAILIVRLMAVGRRLSRSEDDLVEALGRAEAASSAKSRFLSIVSHELRTPLNGVMGMAEVLGRGPLTPLQEGHLGVLKGSAAELLRLIEKILLVTRLEKTEHSAAVTIFDPSDVLAEVVEAHSGRARSAGLQLTLSDSLHGLRTGDPAGFSQILACLLDNALAFTPSGTIQVVASTEGDDVVVVVSDTGPGISPEMQERLFEPFVRGDESLRRSREGAGLGLAICQSLVASMRGDIRLDSTVGKGSTFTVTLPLATALVAVPDEAVAKAA